MPDDLNKKLENLEDNLPAKLKHIGAEFRKSPDV